MTPVSFAAAALLALLAGAEPEKAPPDPRDFGPGTIDVSSWPDDQQRRYEVAAVKCAKCHPFARAVNSHYSSSQWKKYMKKMLRRPNSAINEEQAQHIFEFLKFRAAKEGLAD
jgi:hypothetical protein